MTDHIVIPDSIEPVIGWRCWRLARETRLASIFSSHITWEPREALEAKCRCRAINAFGPDPGTHEPPPGEGATCGIHAFNERAPAAQLAKLMRAGVIGRVALWGKVIEGPRGWRAEFAYPVELTIIRRGSEAKIGWSKVPDLLGLAYGVPVDVECVDG